MKQTWVFKPLVHTPNVILSLKLRFLKTPSKVQIFNSSTFCVSLWTYQTEGFWKQWPHSLPHTCPLLLCVSHCTCVPERTFLDKVTKQMSNKYKTRYNWRKRWATFVFKLRRLLAPRACLSVCSRFFVFTSGWNILFKKNVCGWG